MADNFDIADMVVLYENGRRSKDDLKKLLSEKNKEELVEYILTNTDGEDDDGEERERTDFAHY